MDFANNTTSGDVKLQGGVGTTGYLSTATDVVTANEAETSDYLFS